VSERARASGSERLDLARLAAGVAEAADPGAAFECIAAAAGRAIGHRLFTVMAFDRDTMQVQRLYSSNPRDYPPGGRKAKRDTAWGRHVLEEGRPFIGRSARDIREHFDDHELIAHLGLESVLNVPVRVCARTLGTMNLLHDAAFYDESHLAPGRLLAAVLAGPLLLALRDTG
jgi:GAF domain-containing protein